MKTRLTAASTGTGMLPFFEDALESGIVDAETVYEVLEVNESRRRSGWIIKCKTFQIFLWKSSPICDIMLEALEQLCHTHPSHALYVGVDMETVEGFFLELDDAEARMWTKTKKLRVLDAFKCQKMSVSPPENRLAGKKKA